jgi:hypothetical protein
MKACSIAWCVSLAAEGSDKCVLHLARPDLAPEMVAKANETCVECDGEGRCSDCDGSGIGDCHACGQETDCEECDGTGDCQECKPRRRAGAA